VKRAETATSERRARVFFIGMYLSDSHPV